MASLTKQLRRVIADLAETPSDVGFNFQTRGTFDLNKEGEWSLNVGGSVPIDLANVELETGVTRGSNSEKIGTWKLTLYREPMVLE